MSENKSISSFSRTSKQNFHYQEHLMEIEEEDQWDEHDSSDNGKYFKTRERAHTMSTLFSSVSTP